MDVTRTPLDAWLKLPGNNQTKLAGLVGITQGAISQALKAVNDGKKQAFVVEAGDAVTLEYISGPRPKVASA